MSGIVKFAVKGVAVGIGLASESVKAHKERKAAREAEETGTPSHDDWQSSKQPEPVADDHVLITHVDGTIHRSAGLGQVREATMSTEEFPGHRLGSHPAEGSQKAHASQADLEKIWKLDEAQEKYSRSRSTSPATHGSTQDSNSLADDFLVHNLNPLTDGTSLRPLGHLRLPIVLPQRRPSDRSRGFVRAYAPDLGDCGITQEMFLMFLEKFDKSTQANPMLLTLNLAAVGLEFAPIPSIYGMLAAIGIHQATVVAMELNSRSKTNSFLDKVNNSFFQPRGLYCLIMTHDPDSASSLTEAVDVNKHVASTISSSLDVPSEGRRKRLAHSLQASSGDDFGDLGTMDTAPLVYPKLEEVARSKRARMKAVGSFVSDYKDRRAQAEWANENSMSILAQGPRPQFRSRFSDPNHPASSGDLLALVTAGKLSASNLKEKLSMSTSSIDAKHESNIASSFVPYSGVVHAGNRYDNQVHGYHSNANAAAAEWEGQRDPTVYNQASIPPPPYREYMGNPNSIRPPFANAPAPPGGTYQFNPNTQPHRNANSRDSDDEEQGHAKKERANGTREVLRSVLKKNVLYMMIVKMPSEEEMMRARVSLREQQNRPMGSGII